MTKYQPSSSPRATRAPGLGNFQKLSETDGKEVDRLLAARTRDIRLSPQLMRQFRERQWPQMSKIVRAWMIWVVVLDILTLVVNAALLPAEPVRRMLAPASILIPAALAAEFVFRKPRPLWMQGATILVGVFLILLSVALVGVSAGGEFYERHLTIMLFVAVTAIIIFPVPFPWTLGIAAAALGLYLAFQLNNPAIGRGSALAGGLFFATGVIATVAARHTTNILAHKTFLLVLRDRMRLDELTDANTRLELLARTDPLTGIANRRWMIETLNRLWTGEGEQTRGNAILMCDVDHFKQLNDSLGHAEGDRCLVKVAGIIQSSLRDERDQVARYGGEEFLVLLQNADEQEAAVVAEQIRSRVEAAYLPNPQSTTCPYVTVSIGVSVTPQAGTLITADALQRQADEALYRAKQGGRNRVSIYCGEH